MNRISSIFIHLPIQLVTVWVDDFPNFPFGGICIRSLEGIFQNLCLKYWSNIKWKAELLNGSSSKSQATKTLEGRKCFWCWGVWGVDLVGFWRVENKIPTQTWLGFVEKKLGSWDTTTNFSLPSQEDTASSARTQLSSVPVVRLSGEIPENSPLERENHQPNPPNYWVPC